MGTVDPTCSISPHVSLGGSLGAGPWRNAAMGCRNQSLERSSSLGVLPKNLPPCNEDEDDFFQSQDSATVSLSPPPEVLIYNAGKFCDSADFQSEDFTVSGCSSAAYSFAPIKPALRDFLTDLEAHEITRMEKAKVESRRMWSQDGQLPSARSERRVDTNGGLRTIFLKTGGEDDASRQDSTDVFVTASSRVGTTTPAPLTSGQKKGQSCGSDVSLCNGCPAKEQPSAKESEVRVEGPQVAFWEIDSRGSTGLNFVFVDDFDGSTPNGGGGEEVVTSCTSTTVDSIVLNSLSGGKALLPEGGTRFQVVEGRKILTDLNVNGNPFYGFGSPRGVEAGYPELLDVSFDFVSNTVSADMDGQFVNRSLVMVKNAGSDFLKGFLRDQNGGQGNFCPVFVDPPSCDNHSRSFSDSDVSEGRGRTIPGMAIYRNQLYDQRGGGPGMDTPARVLGGLPSQDGIPSGDVGSDHQADSPNPRCVSKRGRFQMLERTSEGCESERESCGVCGSGEAGYCASGTDAVLVTNGKMLGGDLVIVDGGADGSRKDMSAALAQSYSVLQPSSPEIEAVEDDDNYLKRRTPSSVKSRGHLYDSSRSWMSQQNCNQGTRLMSVETHTGSAALLVTGRNSRGCECQHKRRSTILVVKNLAKLFSCFKG